jgi:transposase InsO family protein
MCKALKIPRSSYYYEESPKIIDSALENAVIKEFHDSRGNYGTRKLKVMLSRRGFIASKRRIGVIMRKYGLISSYTLRNKKKKTATTNITKIPNHLDRNFDGHAKYDVVVSDLTYIKIAGKWRYLCLLLDLCGRKILGSAIGNEHNAKLVESAFYSVQTDLRHIRLFHTDRGSEFNNLLVDNILDTFGIKRSLSNAGNPYDNAVAEAMYSVIKTEFAFKNEWSDLAEFKLFWFDYVNWYNNVRIHGSLGYNTPSGFRGEFDLA